MMKVNFYNSLTNKVEEFIPQTPGKVSMYVCGPTVYNYPHVGNMRPVVVFDTLRRFLTYIGYDVTYVSNYTDVDDKIIKASIQEGKTEKELTEFYIKEFEKNIKAMGCQIPSITPKVTEYINKIIDYIGKLIELGAAYEVDGDVYFRVSKIKDYGALSGIVVDDLIAGARVEENSKKESPLDFALWKKTDVGIKWKTPWGEGRPGWHTECCVMIDTIFDRHMIDIHGGGFDLKFPHHENEIAQARAHNHNQLARYWMHNGFININNEKMSKSLGNVLLAKDIVKQYGGMPFRLMLLNAHYRAPVSFSDDTIQEAMKNANKLQSVYKQLAVELQMAGVDLSALKATNEDKFFEAMCEDLNTPNALAVVYEEAKLANQDLRVRPLPLEKLGEHFAALRDYFFTLGLTFAYPTLLEDDKRLMSEYLALKKEKKFEESDVLRKKLIEKGIL